MIGLEAQRLAQAGARLRQSAPAAVDGAQQIVNVEISPIDFQDRAIQPLGVGQSAGLVVRAGHGERFGDRGQGAFSRGSFSSVPAS